MGQLGFVCGGANEGVGKAALTARERALPYGGQEAAKHRDDPL